MAYTVTFQDKDHADRAALEEKVRAIVVKWQPRIDRLDFSEAAFCRKYKLCKFRLNRAKHGRVPLWPFVQKVEAALAKEGV